MPGSLALSVEEVIVLKIIPIVRRFLASLSVDFNVGEDGNPRITIVKEARSAQNPAHSTHPARPTGRAGHRNRRVDPASAPEKATVGSPREVTVGQVGEEVPF